MNVSGHDAIINDCIKRKVCPGENRLKQDRQLKTGNRPPWWVVRLGQNAAGGKLLERGERIRGGDCEGGGVPATPSSHIFPSSVSLPQTMKENFFSVPFLVNVFG